MLTIGCETHDMTPELRQSVLTRASLDLRGYRPTLEELSSVSRNNANLNKMLDKLLDDPNIGDHTLV